MNFFSRQRRGRTLLLTAVLVWVAAGAAVGQTNITAYFKDVAFKAAVYSKIRKTAPAPILDSDVSGIDSLNVSGCCFETGNISDLSGIEYFTTLKWLDCSWNKLTALNVSKNTALRTLVCYNNELTVLDVSKNTALTGLSCGNNKLTIINVSGATALTSLECKKNQLTALDVSNNTALTDLNCGDNQLTALDVSKNTALTGLNCNSNQLTALDVANNTTLGGLGCGDNRLTALDVSKNTALTELYCKNNRLTALDVSKNTALQRLTCSYNQLTALDVAKHTALANLECSNNQLTALDVSGANKLGFLFCNDNQLTALDVSKNTSLTALDCSTNQLTALDVSNNTRQMELNVRYNIFTNENNIIGLNKTSSFLFNPQRNSVTFNSQGGSAVSSPTAVYTGYKAVKPTDPTYVGYIFGGWYRDATCTGTAWDFNTDLVTANLTLYAKWTLITYIITWNVNGGTPVPTQTSVTHGSSIIAPTTMTKTGGYIFGGWYTNYTFTEVATFPITNVAEPKTFYAKWIATYTVTFNANSGTVTPASGTTRADSTLATLPTPTRTDYAFNGWFTAETNGEKVTESKKYSANTTIFAQWTRSAYTVKLNPNGGTVTPSTVSIGESGRIVSLPDPTKAGYFFDGWFTAATNGEKVTDGYLLSGDITVYAQWTAVYTVTFSAGENGVLTAKIDDSPITSGTSVQQGKSVIFIAIPDDGYDVSGWTVNGAAVANNTTNTYTLTDVSAATVAVSFVSKISVASPDRVIPPANTNNAITSISPVKALTVQLTAGPNPASRSFGSVSFFRDGSRVAYATLFIYDASGNLVKKIRVIDDAVGSQTRRKVSSWNLRDGKGRLVSQGTYLVGGVLKTKDGKRERVSAIVGVRQ